MKRTAIIFVIAAIALLAACSDKAVDTGATLEHMALKIQKEGRLEVVPAGLQYKAELGLLPGDFADLVVLRPKAKVACDELVLVKAKSDEGVSKALSVLDKRRGETLQKWSKLGGVQSEKAKNYVLKSKGLYVLYVVCSEPKKAAKAFDEFFGE